MDARRRAEPGLLETLRELLASVLGHVRLRVQLLGLEVRQEQKRVVQVALLGALAYLFLAITLILAAVTVIAAYWDTPARMSAITGTLAVAGLAALVSGTCAWLRMREPSTLFHASLAELIEDEAMLEQPPATPHAP